MKKITTKRGNHVIEKLNEFEFKINVDNSKRMNVPVTIYADDNLILKMSEDCLFFINSFLTHYPGGSDQNFANYRPGQTISSKLIKTTAARVLPGPYWIISERTKAGR